jgi:AcrR family transcriptional regulator
VQARSARTLEVVVTAGREILSEVGRDHLTTLLVAERAGVSIGTVYRYFIDKIALLDQIQPLAVHGVEQVLSLHASDLRYHHPDWGFTTAEEAADAAGIPVDDVETFEICRHCAELEISGAADAVYDASLWPCATISALQGDRVVRREVPLRPGRASRRDDRMQGDAA